MSTDETTSKIVEVLTANLRLGSGAVNGENVVDAVQSLIAAFGQLQQQNQQLRAALKAVL